MDWAKLTDAKGSAKGIPQLLATLAGADAEKAATAGMKLAQRIFDDGDIFPASVAVVPFLIDIAAAPASHHKELILDALGTIAVGLHHDLLVTGLDRSVPEVAARFKGKRGALRKDGLEAVRKGIDTYVALLSHEDPPVRSQAAFLLAWFPDDGDRVLPALRARVAAERLPGPLASALLSAGLHTKYARALGREEGPPALVPDHASSTVRFASGAAELYVRGASVSDEALGLVAQGGGETVEEDDFPWDDGEVGRFADRLLLSVEPARPERVRELLLARLERDPRGLLRLLPRLFRPSDKPARAAQLEPFQRAVLSAIVDHDDWWLEVGELEDEMSSLGLPSDPVALARWLGKPRKPSPLDRVLSGWPASGKKKPLREIVPQIARGMTEEAQASLLAAITGEVPAEERIDLALAAATVADDTTPALEAWALAVIRSAGADDPEAPDRVARRIARTGPPNVLHDGTFQQLPRVCGYLARVLFEVHGSGPAPEHLDGLLLPLFEHGAADASHRDLLAWLPLQRREPLVLARDPDEDDPLTKGSWLFYDLCPTAAVGEKIIELVDAWPRKVKHDRSRVAELLGLCAPAMFDQIEERARDAGQAHRNVLVLALGFSGHPRASTVLACLEKDKAVAEPAKRALALLRDAGTGQSPGPQVRPRST
jgi:hypothetical protein